MRLLPAGDLVDLVEKNDAVLLDVGERLGLELVVVDQLPGLLVDQRLHRLADLHLPHLAPAAGHLLEHALDLAGEILHSGRGKDLHLRGQHRHLHIDLPVVELALAQHLAKLLPCRAIGGLHVVEIDLARRRQQRVEHALLGALGGAIAHFARLGLARLLDPRLRQIADDGVDVAADVTDLGELGRLDLDERRIGELGEPAGDLGLAHAGGSDHEDVLRRDLLPQRLGDLLPAPPVSQRYRHRPLGRILSDDVLVQLMHDLGRRHEERHGT